MGDLRVVLTMRAKTLNAGQAALPGGRADSLEETPFQTARREAEEEIELVVRPCVALLHSYDEKTGQNADPEESLIPRLDAREVAAVFTAPFHNFLRMSDEDDWGANPADWYQGAWTEWHQSNWRMHQFFVPIRPQSVVKPRNTNQRQKQTVSALEEEEKPGVVTRYRVFGMTARMLVDVARVAYAEEPEFEHNSHFGDERLIAQLRRMGRLSSFRKSGDILTREDMEKAAKLS
ncbi:Peroxisomal coenzyme A diphosphatase nudt7 [Aspergillus hancockii]|nr:Peroxisomal coenzyme A diphosphatase nudt7 [Aspergillus hancockii]